MDAVDFKEFAKEAVDYVVEYNSNIRERRVLSDVEPGYLHKLIPNEAPLNPEHWSQIIPDIERHIMPGLAHWNSPRFSAYFPSGHSYPSIVGDLLSSGIGCIGFNWMTSPAYTELEVIVLDWLAKLMSLPSHFLAESAGPGGGIIQTSASEGILVAFITAKEQSVKRIKSLHPELDEYFIKTKLVAYSCDQANSAIEKAGLLGSMRTRLLPSDSFGRLEASTLRKAIAKDRKNGLMPCIVVATLGTTGLCSFDDLNELGLLCQDENLWFHVDAAYAGAALICPEYRHLATGLEYADSFNMNPHKWLLVNFDCSAFWIKNTKHLVEAFTVERIYLKDKSGSEKKWSPDFRNWEIPLGRRFRALKLWLTLRLYGVVNLQEYIRKHCTLAKQFERLVLQDSRFEVVLQASMGLVCFRLKGDNCLTKELVTTIVDKKELYMNAATFKGKFYIRYAICSRFMEQEDVISAWKYITAETDALFNSRKPVKERKISISDKGHVKMWEQVIEESFILT